MKEPGANEANGSVIAPQTRFMQKFGLTPSEEQVCYWLLSGKSMPEVAAILNKGVATVKHQTLSIYRKLNVSSRPQLFSKYVSDSVLPQG